MKIEILCLFALTVLVVYVSADEGDCFDKTALVKALFARKGGRGGKGGKGKGGPGGPPGGGPGKPPGGPPGGEPGDRRKRDEDGDDEGKGGKGGKKGVGKKLECSKVIPALASKAYDDGRECLKCALPAMAEVCPDVKKGMDKVTEMLEKSKNKGGDKDESGDADEEQ